ncbi:MAG: hypothetical protein ACJAYU_003551 [Bradymonadia bacterium]|jgi:hypothetical protein
MEVAADRAARVKGGSPKWFADHAIVVAHAQAGCVEEAFAALKKVRKEPYPDTFAAALKSVFMASRSRSARIWTCTAGSVRRSRESNG